MIKFQADKRYFSKSEVITHDLIKYDSMECKNLHKSFDTLKNYDVIGIDEGQFFVDLVKINEKYAFLKKLSLLLH